MADKIVKILLCGIMLTVAAVVILHGSTNEDKILLAQTFHVDAVYHHDLGYVMISYADMSKETELVVMEILGMKPPFQKKFNAASFTEIVAFSSVPNYGWAAHPIILEIDHAEMGHIQIKTEVHAPDEPAPPVIYSIP